MRKQHFVASIALSAIGAICLAAPERVLVGIPDISKADLQAKVGKLGKVGNKSPDGFYTVTMAKGVKSKALASVVGAKNLHPEWAIRVNQKSLPSVEAHIHYLKNKARIAGLSGEGEESGVDFYEALEYYLESRVGPDGLLDYDAMQRAERQRDQLPPAYIPGVGNAPGSSFAYVGPKNLDIPYQRYYGTPPLSGRVNGLAVAQDNPSIVFAATAGGGLWKSTDGGANWSLKSTNTSLWKNLATSSVAVSPTNSNVILVGTGDLDSGWDVPYGIMRSTDGGSTWTNVGTAQFGTNNVNKVFFHPDNANIAIALTGGSTGDVWRSTDGGLTWAATNAPAGQWDDIDYCILSGGVRQLYVVGGGSSNKLYKSTNQGSTWTAITNPTGTTQSIMDVACSRVTNGKVWVIAPNNNTIYRSTNSGSSWTNIAPSAANGFPMALGTNASYNWSQDTYDIHLTCGKFNGVDMLYCGLISLAVSKDGGSNWIDLGVSFQSNSRLHNDQQSMVCFPGDSPYAYVGADGGVFLTFFQPGPPLNIIGVTPKNANLYTTQFYHMSVHPSNTTYVMGGTQDNASPASRGNYASWKNLNGGDGAWSAFDPNNPSIHYTQAQGGAIYRYTSAGDTTGDIISPVDANGNVTWSAKFINPLVMSGSTVVTGADNRVKRWTGVAGSWTSSSTSTANAIRTLTVGQSNSNRVYAGCDGGDLYRSDDGGVTITKIDSSLPNSSIGSVATNWSNSIDVLVGLLGSTGGLYRCTDTTAATPVWTNVGGSGATGLPASPINAVMRDPYNASCWYVGTDAGAFMTTNSGATWTTMNGLGIGNVKVNAFAISPAKDYLYCATFGRGIWRLTLVNRTFTAFTAASTSIFGDQSTTATMTLSSAASIGTTAVITDNSSYISAPANVTFTSGTTTKSFTVSSIQAFGTNKTATLTANCLGTTRSITFTIKPYPTVFSYSLSKSAVYGGVAVTGTATLSAAAPFSGSISFTDNSTFVTTPGVVAISAGTVSKAVTITTSKPATATVATLTALYKGTLKTATLTVHPIPTITSFVLNPNPVFGGFATTGTVTLSAPTPIASQIGISEASPVVTTTTPLNMAAGQTTLSFSVGTLPVSLATTVPISARVVGDVIPATVANLAIKPLKLVSITFANNPVTGGTTVGFRVTLNEPAIGRTGASVVCASDKPDAVPSSPVVIPEGALFGDGSVRTATVNVSTNCVISASYNGSIVRSVLTVNP